MPSIASYQSPNDYSLVKEIRPFNLPYESTMQEITTKNSYWKVGANRMKSIYDQAVGLDPQFAQNKDYLRNFMSEANKQLGKISKTDLSVLDNSQQAANVFKPLYDVSNPFNYRLLADSQINKHYQKQQQISDSYRTKDGGKEWNQNNDFYFRDAQQKYLEDAKNGNLDSIESHFQNKKSYIPYYDFKKEILDIQEACKGQSYSTKGVAPNNELYFKESSKSGCSPSELALALKSGLSDRARQQMQIDGYAHFKGNEDVLAKQFTDISITRAKDQVDAIKATIAGIKDGGVSKDEKERLAFYQGQLDQLEPELKKATEEFEEMTKGNVIEYVKKNYDRLAGQVYFNDLTNQLATAYRTDNTKDLVTTNAAGMLKLRLETDRANMYIQDNMDAQADYRNHGYRMKEIRLQGENAKELAILKGEMVNPSQSGIPQLSRPVTSNTPDIPKITKNDFIETNLKPARKAFDDAFSVVNYYVGKALGKNNIILSTKEITNYIKEQETKRDKNQDYNEDALNAWDKFKKSSNDLAFVNDRIEAVNSTIKTTNPELFNDANYTDKKETINEFKVLIPSRVNNYPIEKTNSVKGNFQLSEKDFFKLFKGENVKGFTIETRKEYYYDSDGEGRVQHKDPQFQKELYFNGQLVDRNSNPKLLNLFNVTNKKSYENLTKLSELETKMYTDNSYVNSEQTVFNRGDFGKKEFFEANYGEKLQQYLNASGGLGEKKGYEIIGRDRTGEGVYVRKLNEEAESIGVPKKGEDLVLDKLKESPYGYGVKVDPKSDSYYIPNFFPKYANLPDDATLAKYDKIKEHIGYIETGLKANLTFMNAPVIDSKELPTGGSVRFVSKMGIEYIISIKKERGEPIKYIAQSNKNEYKAQNMDQLLAIIDPQKF